MPVFLGIPFHLQIRHGLVIFHQVKELGIQISSFDEGPQPIEVHGNMLMAVEILIALASELLVLTGAPLRAYIYGLFLRLYSTYGRVVWM